MKNFFNTLLISLEAHRLASSGRMDEARKLMLGK